MVRNKKVFKKVGGKENYLNIVRKGKQTVRTCVNIELYYWKCNGRCDKKETHEENEKK